MNTRNDLYTVRSHRLPYPIPVPITTQQRPHVHPWQLHAMESTHSDPYVSNPRDFVMQLLLMLQGHPMMLPYAHSNLGTRYCKRWMNPDGNAIVTQHHDQHKKISDTSETVRVVHTENHLPILPWDASVAISVPLRTPAR